MCDAQGSIITILGAVGVLPTALFSPAGDAAQDGARSSAPAAQAPTWVAHSAMAHGAAAAAALAPELPLWGPLAARGAVDSSPSTDPARNPKALLGALGTLPPGAAFDAALNHPEPERSGRPLPPGAADRGRGAECHAAVEADVRADAAESAFVADALAAASCSEAAAAKESELTAKRQRSGAVEAPAAAADEASAKRQRNDAVAAAAAAAADEAAAKRQRSRESAAAMQPLPLPEGLGDAAAAAAAYRPEMAEMRALLAAHGVRLPRVRFDDTDAELFRFAATMGLLKARSPEERWAPLHPATLTVQPVACAAVEPCVWLTRASIVVVAVAVA